MNTKEIYIILCEDYSQTESFSVDRNMWILNLSNC